MRIKLYKKTFFTSISLEKHTPYKECYYACIEEELVRIKHFNLLEKILSKTIVLEEPSTKEENTYEEIREFQNVKEYKKDYLRRYNVYCCRVDEELRKKENRN